MARTTPIPPAANTPESPLDDIVKFLDRFVIFPSDNERDVMALWIVHTWAFDAAYTTPYIYVNSPEKQSGKTRVLEVAEALSRNSVVTSSGSASTLFRIIETTRPTLFIDEVDTVFTGTSNEELRNILNSGYKHNGSVMRTVPASPDDPTGGVRMFSTFAPKLLAGINNGNMPDTISDRSIFINLKRKRKDQEVERLMARKLEQDVKPIIAKIEAWVAHNMEALVDAEPKVMENLGDRAWDIAEPLVAIAERNRGWGKRARNALSALLVQEERILGPGAQALQAAKDLFDETKAQRIPSALLAERLDTTGKNLGLILKPYGITTRNLRFGSNQAKGYERADFADAWQRYI